MSDKYGRTVKDLFTQEHECAVVTGGYRDIGEIIAHTFKTAGDKVVAMEPRKRIGEPADMAGTGIYLSSKVGSYVTGFTRPVVGGVTGAL